MHINLLEMMAFYNVLLSFRAHLANSLVDCYIDNQSAMFKPGEWGRPQLGDD
jgi:hypothetical protein